MAVVGALGLVREVAEVRHSSSDNRTELEYRLAWARTRLKKAGLVESPSKANWRLTDAGWRKVRLARNVPDADG